MHYAKIFDTIIDSSLWSESSDTRVLFISMVVASDRDGVIRASTGGLARMANITLEACKTALNILEAPDLDSKDKDYGGRRVERLDSGGWKVFNKAKYRDLKTPEQTEWADRKRIQRRGERTVELRAAEQGGKCGCCGQRFDIPLLQNAVCDHDHTTGVERGAICHSCNYVIGRYERGEAVRGTAGKRDNIEGYLTRWGSQLRPVTSPEVTADDHPSSVSATQMKNVDETSRDVTPEERAAAAREGFRKIAEAIDPNYERASRRSL